MWVMLLHSYKQKRCEEKEIITGTARYNKIEKTCCGQTVKQLVIDRAV